MSKGAVSPQSGDSSVKPVFGFVLLGGALTGARVRDVYLMNELVRRGYRCHVWWAHERDRDAGIHPEITQSWLFHHARYAGYVQWIVGKSIGRPIDDWLGITTQLVIVGANGFGYSYSDACRQIAGHLSLNVRWKDYVKIEVRNALMQLSDCLVCPSIHGEPFGIVVIEAMSLGTPVIVPNIGGSQEIICRDNLSAGMTFTSHDSGSLCDKLRMLLSNESLRSELGTNGLTLVHNWTSELVAERTLSAFLPDLQSGVVEGSAPQACTAQVSATP